MDEIYLMWQYARANAKTGAQQHESLADDLDAAFGIGTWRLSRNMDEQPSENEHAVVFTYMDGDEQGDFQVFVPNKRPRIAVIIRMEGEDFTGIETVCYSARQATHVAAVAQAIANFDAKYIVEMIDPCMDMSRLSIARQYIDGSPQNVARIIQSDAVDEDEKSLLVKQGV